MGCFIYLEPALLWKCVRIVPIYKGKGEMTVMSSYYPVALLPVISKVLEAGMVQQINQHLKETSVRTCNDVMIVNRQTIWIQTDQRCPVNFVCPHGTGKAI